MGKVGKGYFLCLIEILQQCTCRNHSVGEIFNSHSNQRIHMKVTEQNASAGVLIKQMCVQCTDGDIQTISQIFQVKSAYHKRIITNNFGRSILHDLIQKLFLILHFCEIIITCGYICHRQTNGTCCIGDTHQIIVPGVIHALQIQIGPRGNDSGYFSFHQALGSFGIFHLFTDSHLIPFLNQLIQIHINRMKRDAAHRCTLLHAAILSGQSDLQFPGTC